MDPITAAILAAIAAGVLGGLTDLSKTALTDAYGSLKALIAKKFGPESEVIQAVTQVETKPASAARKAALAEEIAAVHAEQDADLLAAAQSLQRVLPTTPGREVGDAQTATGNYIAQADREGQASVQIGGTPPPRP